MVVVNGGLAPDDWFPLCRIGLFFLYKKVKLIDVLQGYIVKGLELAEPLQSLVGSEMPFRVPSRSGRLSSALGTMP